MDHTWLKTVEDYYWDLWDTDPYAEDNSGVWMGPPDKREPNFEDRPRQFSICATGTAGPIPGVTSKTCNLHQNRLLSSH